MGISKKAWRSFHLPPSHQPTLIIPPQSPAPPPPLTQPAITTSPSFPTIRPATPNIFPSPNIFLPHPLSSKSPQNLPSDHPCPEDSPTSSTSRQAAILPLPPRPRLHARTTPALPSPTPASYPAPSQAPPQLEQTPPPPHQDRNLPFCHQASHCPATSCSILWNNRSPTSLRTSPAPTHPRPHSLTKDARDGPLPVRHMQPPDPAPSHRPHPISSQAIDT